MSKPNRYDVAKAVGELPSATEEAVVEAMGADVDTERVQHALESAAKHGLITKGAGDNGAATWEISDKGKRKVAANT